MKMKTITAKLKGFYFQRWELTLIRSIGFKIPMASLELTRKADYAEWNTYKVLENPKPIRLTPEKRDMIIDLPNKMNAIDITIDKDTPLWTS